MNPNVGKSRAKVDRERAWGLRPASPEDYGVRKVRKHGVTLKVEFKDLSATPTMDLRELPAAEVGIHGYTFYVENRGGGYESKTYILVREPENPEDSDAVAIYNVERKIGYLTRTKAAQLAPSLDALPAEAFVVDGVVGSPGRMLLRVPKVAELRRFVREQARSGNQASPA